MIILALSRWLATVLPINIFSHHIAEQLFNTIMLIENPLELEIYTFCYLMFQLLLINYYLFKHKIYTRIYDFDVILDY